MNRAAIGTMALLGLLGFCGHASARQTRTGRLEIRVADDFADGEATTSYRLRTEGGSVPVLPTKLASAEPGDPVRVTGSLRDGYLVGAVQTSTAQTSSRPYRPKPSGPQTVAVVRIALEEEEGPVLEPPSEEEFRELTFTGSNSADEFYEQESYGKVSLTGIEREDGDVFGPYTAAFTPGTCDIGTWREEADREASEAGVDLASYDYLLYVIPTISACRWGGLALPVDSLAFINGEWGNSSRTIAHELGHDFGLGHAHALVCEDEEGYRVPLSDSCEMREYGDGYDVMGGDYMFSHAWYRNMLGFLPASDITEVTSDGIYTLHAAYYETAATTVLRIPRRWVTLGPELTGEHEEPIEWYDLEVRQGTGPFETTWGYADRGVLIRASPAGTWGSTLIYANQQTAADGNGEWALQPGSTFTDGGLVLKTLSAGEGVATVEVHLATPPPDLTPPSTPGRPSARVSGWGMALNWAASKSEEDLKLYTVYRDGEMIGTSPTPEYEDPVVPPGPHTYVIYAEDTSGNVSNPSAAALVQMPDVTPPARPEALTATATSSGVRLRWDESHDDVGVVRYVVLRDGERIGYSADAMGTDSGAQIGRHTYAVYAEDAAGNRSDLSAPATVDVLDRTAPSAPGSPIASRVDGGVSISWQASHDDVGVARYVVFRDRFEVGRTAATKLLDTGVRAGSYVYTIYAEDAADNRSGPSAGAAISLSAPHLKAVRRRRKPALEVSWRRLGRRLVRVAVRSSRQPLVARLVVWVDGRRCARRQSPRLVARCPLAMDRARAHRDHHLTVLAATRKGVRRAFRAFLGR